MPPLSASATAAVQEIADVRGYPHGNGSLFGVPVRMYPTRGVLPACCARVAIGHAAAPPSSVMNLRRLIGSLSPRVTPYHIVVAMPPCASQQNWHGNGR